jgi:hypothetical protein
MPPTRPSPKAPMQLVDLVRAYDWRMVLPTFRRLFPNAHMENHAVVFERLRFMEARPSRVVLLIEVVDEPDNDPWVNVSGSDGKNKYAIDFTPWAEWLGMEIAPLTRDIFGPAEVISHSLHEMTFAGFDEKKIQGIVEDAHATYEQFKKEKADLKKLPPVRPTP